MDTKKYDPKVLVVGLTYVPLMPTTPAKARRLLKEGKAEVYCKRPFTIHLLYKTGCATQPTTPGIDTGSQHIGIAVIRQDQDSENGTVLIKTDVELRSSMEKRKLMEARATLRRGRRYRKTRYRHPKFKFTTKRVYSEKPDKNGKHWHKLPNDIQTKRPEGWLPPSIESKVEQHKSWINRYMNVLPKDTTLRIELGRFDIQHMENPEIHGEMYQQGNLYEYENVKAFVFDRDGYTCQVCKRKAGTLSPSGKTVKLIAHHIDMRVEGATDRPDSLITVCTECHTTAAHKPGGILYEWKQKNKKKARGYRDATFMNILQKRLVETYRQEKRIVEFTYGNFTAVDRRKLLLEKNHANDAVAIAGHRCSSIEDSAKTLYYKQVRSKKRSLHEATPRKGRMIPNRAAKRNEKNTKQVVMTKKDKRGEKASLVLHPWDKVYWNGTSYWLASFACKGSAAYLVNFSGDYVKTPSKKTDAKPAPAKVPCSKLYLSKQTYGWIISGTEKQLVL